MDKEKERQGVKCAIHNEEIRPADRKEREWERRKRTKASRRPNNGKPARSRGSQQWQSTAHCQTGVNCQPAVPWGDRPREPRDVGQAGRDFAVARRAIGSEAWARDRSTIINGGCSRSEWWWYRDERYLEPPCWFLFRRTHRLEKQRCHNSARREYKMQLRSQKYAKTNTAWRCLCENVSLEQ